MKLMAKKERLFCACVCVCANEDNEEKKFTMLGDSVCLSVY